MKNDIDLMPAHVRTNNTLRGYLFIAFLALILRMKLMRRMVEAGFYRDKGYFGASARGISVTMYRATRSHPLCNWDRMRNLQISRIRAPGERPFAVIKTVFKATHVLVTTVERVNVKMVFTAIAFNLYQLRTLHRAGLV